MIVIRDGHILFDMVPPTRQEIDELTERVQQGLLRSPVSADCLHALRLYYCSPDASPTDIVARDYRPRNHRFLLCIGGFLGKCVGNPADESDEPTKHILQVCTICILNRYLTRLTVRYVCPGSFA